MSYADSIGAVAPLFTPYVMRRDSRLFLVVPAEAGRGAVRSFELSAVQVAEMAVGLHVVLHAVGCEARREHAEAACTQAPESVSTGRKLPQVWSGQHV
jgi:hypothetical protein